MKYISTRGNYSPVSASEAIKLGMVPEGGLFVPEKVPELSLEKILSKKDNSYQEIASWILEYFLSDFDKGEIKNAVNKAYNNENFLSELITPLVSFDENTYIMELWHGPTAAFKDLALQLMPYLLNKAVKKSGSNKEIVILVATSGDTGKAALEGFKDVEGVKIIVLYPENGVSKIQKDQMITTGGSNTEVIAVKGNFDDCQNAVKKIFGDKNFNKKIKNNGFQFSSANSINWGRLVPQIVYYFAAYFYLIKKEVIKSGEKINITVPTGNFGNILAAYYAYRMGLPVNKFICASNENKILTDFIRSGKYDIKRKFKKTISPSMDILISSNLERFLFEITNHDSERINHWYKQLNENGEFEIDEENVNKINELFVGKYATEGETKETIKQVYNNYDYLIDPHTGVALSCLGKYRNNKDKLKTNVVDSTANPYKFSKAVLESIKGELKEKDDYKIINKLKELTDTPMHRALAELENESIKHYRKTSKDKVKEEISDILFK